jgi:DNA-binding MarR family transcriptional regulator
VTGLAEVMGVTKGAISQILNKLVNKGLVVKKSADDNAKEILPELTEVGLKGYGEHERFHTIVFEMVRDYYGDRFGTELDKFMSVMTDLNHIIDRFEEKGLQR